MTRLLLLAAVTAAAVGCTSTQSNPFGKMPAPKADAKDVADAKDTPAPGSRPVPPAILITPGEVAPDNPAAAATKLGNELEYDLKNTPPAPKTPIVTRYKNGEKVQ